MKEKPMRAVLRVLRNVQLKPRPIQLVVPFAILLTSCATQTPSPPARPASSPSSPPPVVSQAEPASHVMLRNLVSMQDRLYRVTAPLLVSNAELCKGNARNLVGFTAKNKYSYSAELSNAAESLLRFDEQLQITGVLPKSGAAKGGIKRGDKLLAIEGKPVPAGEDAERQAAMLLLPLMRNRPNIKLTVQRDGSVLPLTIALTRACAFGVELGNADHVNAYNDGRRVLITRGMMNFVQSDIELAYVLAKELAHNALRHASKQNMTGTVGEIMDNLVRLQPDLSTMAGTAGIKSMPLELEAEADRLALYMLARAGYNLSAVPRFWERLASQYPPSVLNGYYAIHPGIAQRLPAIEKTLSEIKSKQASRRSLVP